MMVMFGEVRRVEYDKLSRFHLYDVCRKHNCALMIQNCIFDLNDMSDPENELEVGIRINCLADDALA